MNPETRKFATIFLFVIASLVGLAMFKGDGPKLSLLKQCECRERDHANTICPRCGTRFRTGELGEIGQLGQVGAVAPTTAP